MITERTSRAGARPGARPAGDLPRTSRLTAQVLVQGAALVGQEVALAKTELRANARPAGRNRLTRVIPGLPMTSQSIREDLRELREATRP